MFNRKSIFCVCTILLVVLSLLASVGPASASDQIVNPSITILVDDFQPQPYQENPIYYYNRLDGDRGALNNSNLVWGNGQVKATISSGNSWGGIWISLNHPIVEHQSINFSAILPEPILPAYQSQVTGITIQVADGTPGRAFRLELKDAATNLQWSNETILSGGQQVISRNLPALGNINQLVLVLDRASAGDYVVVERVSFTATTQITDTATAAFVWSYGMLLNNWNPATGLARDKAKDPSGAYDAIQATGSVAATTALAEQAGVISQTSAVQIVNKIGDTLLNDVPKYHGLWPHWVEVLPGGQIAIKHDTEWSSVDTVISAISLLDAQNALGLDTSGTEQMLRDIDWNNLQTPNGISHGYNYAGDLIPYAWDTFGGESWLVELAYAAATDRVTTLAYPSPPTANGSGFIDELAWMYLQPPSVTDTWGTDWDSYRASAADTQTSYYPLEYPASCFSQSGLFGLSAAEVPDPSVVSQSNIYQAFGVGGQFSSVNDGSALLGAPVVAPHYAAMLASLRPQAAIAMWDWLISNGHFSPLNNIESLMYLPNANCNLTAVKWNQLKGSWNLSLQTLGWGSYLAKQRGQVPNVRLATWQNQFLRKGYLLLAPNGLAPIVVSSRLSNPNPTSAANVNFTISFSGTVTGVDVTDFSLTTTGITGASITGVSGSGATRTVSATTGSGEGTLRLDVLDDDSILDAVSNPLGGAGLGNGAFSAGETYTIDNPPVVSSIMRAGASPTNAASVNYTVTFSKSVSGVDASDFSLTTSGVNAPSITGISGSGAAYVVAINTGTANGTIRLDVSDNDSILDAVANPLGGAGIGNGNFTSGEIYSIDKTISLTFKSNSAQDGWVLESRETSNKGGLLNNKANTFNVGDDAAKRQYRAILSFATGANLPDNAVITGVTLNLKKSGILGGGNPVALFKGFMVDIKKGTFGTAALQAGDFQATASKSYGPFNTALVGGWYRIDLTSAILLINKLATGSGLTQIRLRFKLDDNNDTVTNIVSLYSGSASAANRPQLVITYYAP